MALLYIKMPFLAKICHNFSGGGIQIGDLNSKCPCPSPSRFRQPGHGHGFLGGGHPFGPFLKSCPSPFRMTWTCYVFSNSRAQYLNSSGVR